MYVKEISIEVKLSRNYQTVTNGAVISMEESDDLENIYATTFSRLKKMCYEELSQL